MILTRRRIPHWLYRWFNGMLRCTVLPALFPRCYAHLPSDCHRALTDAVLLPHPHAVGYKHRIRVQPRATVVGSTVITRRTCDRLPAVGWTHRTYQRVRHRALPAVGLTYP